MKIYYQPIGLIHTPYHPGDKVPIQGVFFPGSRGTVEVFPEYADGLLDVEGFSHLILIYHFHFSQGFSLIAKPYMDGKEHGIFSIRSPKRPNPIGFSIVRLVEKKGNTLLVDEVDILDKTPLLDIKPYIGYFDLREDATSGWITPQMIQEEEKFSN